MARLPMGKMLLRNVIRHTDAHNKIQEEAEMWKMRDWQTQMSNHKHLSADCMRGHMHCDRVADYSPIRSRERSSGHDDREARYWSRKLYEFEANDPERWGHSGFKELYPEEFESDGEESSGSKKNPHHKTKKAKSNPNSSKRSKKSSKKKKKNGKKKRKKAECSSSDNSNDSSATKSKRRRKRTKVRHKTKKSAKTKEDSSSSDSEEEGERERRTHTRKKRKLDKGSDSGLDTRKRRRKNWKAANESSDESSLE